MAIKKTHHSPIFYLALIPMVTWVASIAWRLATESRYLRVDYNDAVQSQLALILSGVVWLLIISFALKIKLSQPDKVPHQTTVRRLLSVGAAGFMAVVMFACLFELSAFTGLLFAFLCLLFVAGIMLSITQNRWFYSTFGVLMVALPILYLFAAPYRVQRLKDMLLGGAETDLFYYPVAENLHSSVLWGSARADWYDVPAYYGQMLMLKGIHSVGYIPALLLVALVFAAWVFAAASIYRAKQANPFWQSLAYYLALFFIIEATINVFGNLNLLKTVMTTNIMPFSSNGALWVLFVAFLFACWKMNNKMATKKP